MLYSWLIYSLQIPQFQWHNNLISTCFLLNVFYFMDNTNQIWYKQNVYKERLNMMENGSVYKKNDKYANSEIKIITFKFVPFTVPLQNIGKILEIKLHGEMLASAIGLIVVPLINTKLFKWSHNFHWKSLSYTLPLLMTLAISFLSKYFHFCVWSWRINVWILSHCNGNTQYLQIVDKSI